MNRMAAIVGMVLAAACCVPGQNGPASGPPDPRAIVRRAVDHERTNFEKQRNYTYVERAVTRRGKGAKPDSATWEVMVLYGEHVRRLIARDGQPISPQEQAAEERRIQKLIDSRKQETPEQARRRLAEYERKRQEQRAFVSEIYDAYDFQLTGEASLDGRETYVVAALPRPGYHARQKRARMLSKFRATVWIDKAEDQWVKLDAEAIDDLSFGWFLGKLNRGAHVIAEQTRVNDEVWLPRQVEVDYSGRKLFSSFAVELDISYKDYRKFRAETQVLPASPTEPPPAR